MAAGVVPYGDPMNLGMLGMHGCYTSNRAVAECDVLIAVGTRFSDRVALNPKTFAKNATIIIVSHSMEEVARTVDRLVVVNDGRIPFQGPPREVFRHGAELERMGLGVPQMTRVFSRLRAMGVDIDASVYTIPQAKETILRRLREKGVE